MIHEINVNKFPLLKNHVMSFSTLDMQKENPTFVICHQHFLAPAYIYITVKTQTYIHNNNCYVSSHIMMFIDFIVWEHEKHQKSIVINSKEF